MALGQVRILAIFTDISDDWWSWPLRVSVSGGMLDVSETVEAEEMIVTV